MSKRVPLSEVERERIYQGKLQGKTLAELAAELDCSEMCVRKWWRRLRDAGLPGLRTRPHGRPPQGVLSRFAPQVRQTALQLKQRHPRWGADRVLVELRQAQPLHGLALPHRSRLATFFKRHCPECVAKRQPQPAAALPPPKAAAVHQLWKLDAQEGLRLQDGTVATVCTIRDPFGAAMIASRAFAVQTAKHWRKLTWQEYRQVLREGASEWRTLPDMLQSDGELGVAGTPNDPFPGLFTLWLVGLGVAHHLSRPGRPTDQAEVERTHRTLDDWALDAESLADLPSLQQALERERRMYHEQFPARASDCAQRPPLVAHPELRVPRHPYACADELALFDLTRVDRYLAAFGFQRKVNATGQVSLGRHLYSVGRRWAGQALIVCFDPEPRQWVFFLNSAAHAYREIASRAIKGLDTETLTGLRPPEVAAPA